MGNRRKRGLRADFEIINYKYTIGGRRVYGIRRIIGKSYMGDLELVWGVQTLECLITFEHDEGNTALFVGVGHRCGIDRGGVGITLEVFD